MTIDIQPGKLVETTGDNMIGLWRPSFVETKDHVYAFGGGGNATKNVYSLNLTDMKWKLLDSVTGTPPSKRYGHTTTLWNENHMIVFGGCDENQDYLNDLHVFDIQNKTWTQPHTTLHQQSTTVTARYLHAASIYDNKLFVYGGFTKNHECTYVLGDMSVLDLSTFTWTSFPSLIARYNHSVTIVDYNMYIFGGKDVLGDTVSDIFVVNMNQLSYRPKRILDSRVTGIELAKSNHFCKHVDGKLVIFGQFSTNTTTASDEQKGYKYRIVSIDLKTFESDENQLISDLNFETGRWNYFTTIKKDQFHQHQHKSSDSEGDDVLMFLGNKNQATLDVYDHFRDALFIDSKSILTMNKSLTADEIFTENTRLK